MLVSRVYLQTYVYSQLEKPPPVQPTAYNLRLSHALGCDPAVTCRCKASADRNPAGCVIAFPQKRQQR
jgi:hypothetical protein